MQANSARGPDGQVDVNAKYMDSPYFAEVEAQLNVYRDAGPSASLNMRQSPYQRNVWDETIILLERGTPVDVSLTDALALRGPRSSPVDLIGVGAKSKYTRPLLAQRVMPRVVMGLIIASIWADLGTNGSTDLQNRNSVLFMISIFTGMSANFYTPDIMEDRPLFVRERSDRFYRPVLYVLGQFLVQVPPLVLGSVLFSAIAYWAIGLDAEAGKFGYFVLMIIAIATTGTLIASKHHRTS
eukprot:scaffold3759_cov425-Prasinococcus_capsulatus_cf.AAC.14